MITSSLAWWTGSTTTQTPSSVRHATRAYGSLAPGEDVSGRLEVVAKEDEALDVRWNARFPRLRNSKAMGEWGHRPSRTSGGVQGRPPSRARGPRVNSLPVASSLGGANPG